MAQFPKFLFLKPRVHTRASANFETPSFFNSKTVTRWSGLNGKGNRVG